MSQRPRQPPHESMAALDLSEAATLNLQGRKAARLLRYFRAPPTPTTIDDTDECDLELDAPPSTGDDPILLATYFPHSPNKTATQHFTAKIEFDHVDQLITNVVESEALPLPQKPSPLPLPQPLQPLSPLVYPLAVELRPFKNKVGGHTAIFSFSKQAVCKALVNRENVFYEAVEHHHRQILKFMPKYIGVLNVRYSLMVPELATPGAEPVSTAQWPREVHEALLTRDADIPELEMGVSAPSRRRMLLLPLQNPAVVLDDNKHMIPNSLWKQYLHLIPLPQQYPLEVDEDVKSNHTTSGDGSTTVNTDLQAQVLKEVFQPFHHAGLGDEIFAMDEDQPGEHHSNETTPTAGPVPLTASPVLCKHTRFERFILLEDLTCDMKYPCVLDLKMGTRQYGIEATAAKQKSQRRKCAQTTLRELGVRICGLQIFSEKGGEVRRLVRDKYFGRRVSAGCQFAKTLAKYLYDGAEVWLIVVKIPLLIDQLINLRQLISQLKGYRLYGLLVLLMHDADGDSGAIMVKIIDFAQLVIAEPTPMFNRHVTIPPQHPETSDRGYVRGLNLLVFYLETIFRLLTGHKYTLADEASEFLKNNRPRFNNNCQWLEEFAESSDECLVPSDYNDPNDPFNVLYDVGAEDDDVSD